MVVVTTGIALAFDPMQRVLQRRNQNFAAIIVGHLALLDERNGGDEGLDGAGKLPVGCVLNGTRYGAGGDGAVSPHDLFELWLR